MFVFMTARQMLSTWDIPRVISAVMHIMEASYTAPAGATDPGQTSAIMPDRRPGVSMLTMMPGTAGGTRQVYSTTDICSH
jgi:hypothetical protein